MQPAVTGGSAPSSGPVLPGGNTTVFPRPPGWTDAQWQQYGPQYVAQQQAQARAAQPPPAPAPAPAQQLLPGIVVAGGNDNKSPMVSLIAYEKQGKSTTAITSLVNWPEQGMEPLVLAFDPHGPDACVKVGYHPHVLRIREQPGSSTIDKARNALAMLQQNLAFVHKRYGSLVVDCTSTMVMQLHDDAKKLPKNINNNDTRAPYFDLGLFFKEIIKKVVDLGLPSVWLAWLMEGSTSQGGKDTAAKTELGGPDIMGRKLRNFLAGTAHHNFVLEKYKVAKGGTDPWGGTADDENCVRVIHTKPWGLINAGGRYSHILPDPAPANLGWIFSKITGRGPYR